MIFFPIPISCSPSSLTFMLILQNRAVQMKSLCVNHYYSLKNNNPAASQALLHQQPGLHLHALPTLCVARPALALNSGVRVFKGRHTRCSYRLGAAGSALGKAVLSYSQLQQHPWNRCNSWVAEECDAPMAGRVALPPSRHHPVVGNLLGTEPPGLTSWVRRHTDEVLPPFGFPISWKPMKLKDGIWK